MKMLLSKTVLLIGALVLGLSFSPVQAKAENWSSATYQQAANGSIPPILLMTLLMKLFNSCAAEIEQHVPPTFPAPNVYVKSATAWQEAFCRIGSCFQFGMLFSILPMLSGENSSSKYADMKSNSSAGGMGSQGAVMMAQSFSSSNEACPNTGSYKPMPNILPMIMAMSQ